MKTDLQHIISQCKRGESQAQKELYGMYAPLFMSIAMRYMKVQEEAEDVMVMAFYKIFSAIDTYKGDGSFEGWMKRILVNEALMQIRKKNNLHISIELSETDSVEMVNALDEIGYSEILELMDRLPMGYRTVFNMYVIEGYKHKEIAELLDISINTSKSQLILAKKRMQELFKKKECLRGFSSSSSNQQI